MKQDKRQYKAPETCIVTTSDDLMQTDGMLYTSWQGAEDEEPLPYTMKIRPKTRRVPRWITSGTTPFGTMMKKRTNKE